MKKRVLIFCLFYYPLFTSGAEAAVKEITDRLDPEEFEFHMVTLHADSSIAPTEQVGNILVHRIGFSAHKPTFVGLDKWPLKINKPLFQFWAAVKAFQLHRRYRFDATWAIMAHSSGVPAALFKLMYPRVPFVLTLQEGDPPEHIERVMKPLWPLFTRAFTTATVVQSISSFLSGWARARHFKGPIVLVPNGANPRDVQDMVPAEEQERAKLAIQKQPGEVVLMNTARVVHQKGHDTVIRALPLLPTNVRYVMVGDGPDEPMLRELSKELGVESRVFFTGRVDRSRVTSYRKAADIFIGPSRSEGLGLSFLSAMASRLPLITTQEGGLVDFIFDAKRNPDRPTTAWAVDKESPEQIAEAVTEIMNFPEKTARVTENARQLILQSYTWDTIARQMRERVFLPLWNSIPTSRS